MITVSPLWYKTITISSILFALLISSTEKSFHRQMRKIITLIIVLSMANIIKAYQTPPAELIICHLQQDDFIFLGFYMIGVGTIALVVNHFDEKAYQRELKSITDDNNYNNNRWFM